jgi:hypothetical protein
MPWRLLLVPRLRTSVLSRGYHAGRGKVYMGIVCHQWACRVSVAGGQVLAGKRLQSGFRSAARFTGWVADSDGTVCLREETENEDHV